MKGRSLAPALALGLALSLGACASQAISPQNAATASSLVAQANAKSVAVEAACAEAQPLLPAAGLIPVIGGYVAAGVQVGCNTAAGLAKLTADPTSAVWLGEQIQIMKNALGRA